MSKPITNWSDAPLLRAGTQVINTPVKTKPAQRCSGIFMRFNVGNIHAIKEFRSVLQQG